MLFEASAYSLTNPFASQRPDQPPWNLRLLPRPDHRVRRPGPGTLICHFITCSKARAVRTTFTTTRSSRSKPPCVAYRNGVQARRPAFAADRTAGRDRPDRRPARLLRIVTIPLLQSQQKATPARQPGIAAWLGNASRPSLLRDQRPTGLRLISGPDESAVRPATGPGADAGRISPAAPCFRTSRCCFPRRTEPAAQRHSDQRCQLPAVRCHRCPRPAGAGRRLL